MAIRLDIYGRDYDDAEPVFIPCFNSAYVFDRLNHAEMLLTDLQAYATSISYTLAAPEIGTASAAWLAGTDFPGEDASSAPTPAPAGKPLTISVTKAPSGSTADDTGTVTVAGGPADKAYTVSFGLQDALSAGVDSQTVTIPKGTTAAQAAALIAAAESDPNATATASGAVVTFAPKSGSTITTLTATIA